MHIHTDIYIYININTLSRTHLVECVLVQVFIWSVQQLFEGFVSVSRVELARLEKISHALCVCVRVCVSVYVYVCVCVCV
jgi:hypothetical protein